MLYSKPLLFVEYLFFHYKSSILFILSQTSGIKMSIFLARQKFISCLIYIIHILFIYICIYKSFSATVDEDFLKNIKK